MKRLSMLCLAAALVLVLAPRPSLAADSLLNGKTIHLLLSQGAYADSVQSILPDLNKLAGGTIAIDTVGENELYPIARMNAASRASAYDIVAIESASTSAYGTSHIVLPLNSLVDRNPRLLEPDDFLPIALESFSSDETILTLPIQSN